MAYGLKYTIPFKDVDNYSNVVEIYQDNYVGSSTELIATDVPAVHKYEREDNEDITSSIMSSTLTISFYSTDVTDFTSFFSYSDREFLVIHKFEGSTVFKGYLLNDITGEPFQDPPYPVVLTATDGLGQLKEFQMTGPSADTDLGTLIFNQLNSLDLELNVQVCNDLYEGLVMDNTKSIFNQSAGENLLIQKGTFDQIQLNAFEFLAEICKTFGWVLFQSNAKWRIQRAIGRNINTTTTYLHNYDTLAVISSSNETALEVVADQDNVDTDWIPVNADQLLQYQRPYKKLTLVQGGLGQSIIANGENFNENSWYLEGPYKPVDWTVTPDPDSTPIQVFPNNIPSQGGYDDEQGVSWDIRFEANGEETDQPITSKPLFLDFAGLSLDLEVDIQYSTSSSGLAVAVKHVDSSNNVKYLNTTIIGSLGLLEWTATYNTFVFYSTKDNDTRKFKLTSFVLPTAGFLSVELKYFGLTNETGNAVVTNVKIIPTFDGVRNPSEVKKVYETAREYTSIREDDLVFSDLCITASKNWLKIGDLPAIVFVEKSLAATPNIIQEPSGAVTQVNRLTDTLGSNSLSFSGGTVTGAYQRQFVSAAGFTIDSVFILVSSLSGNPPPPSAELNVSVTTISSTQRNVTITLNGYDYTGEANVQIQVFLKDSNSNNYQTSTFLFQVNANGTFTYTQTNISFENQALLGGYSPTLRDCYARNVLSLYNALSYRLEGSFRRKGNSFGSGFTPAQLDYVPYQNGRYQVIGWEYDLASRVARITFGQVPTAYVYPIS